MDIDYPEALRLIRKHMRPGDTLGQMFMRVATTLETEAAGEVCRACGKLLICRHCGKFRSADEPRHLAQENPRWEISKNGWDASDEATREDI